MTEAHHKISFQFMLEKIKDKGEDAEPILLDKGIGLTAVGVLDGMGGAGATVYEINDSAYTGAYLASRRVRKTLENYINQLSYPHDHYSDRQLDIDYYSHDIKDKINLDYENYLNKIGDKPSRLRSNLVRRLPTTLALAFVETVDAPINLAVTRPNTLPDHQAYLEDTKINARLQNQDTIPNEWTHEYWVHLIWAGDSRIYLLTENGLQQLTKDDVRSGGDALENLINDSPMSNYINGDVHYELHSRAIKLPWHEFPFAVIACSDGCFGYYPTPIYFEYVLLNTLNAAHTIEEWKHNLITSIEAVAADDVSLAMVACGWKSLGDLQEKMRGRLTELFQKYIQQWDAHWRELRQLQTDLENAQSRLEEHHQQARQLRESQWSEYKTAYEEYIGEG